MGYTWVVKITISTFDAARRHQSVYVSTTSSKYGAIVQTQKDVIATKIRIPVKGLELGLVCCCGCCCDTAARDRDIEEDPYGRRSRRVRSSSASPIVSNASEVEESSRSTRECRFRYIHRDETAQEKSHEGPPIFFGECCHPSPSLSLSSFHP